VNLSEFLSSSLYTYDTIYLPSVDSRFRRMISRNGQSEAPSCSRACGYPTPAGQERRNHLQDVYRLKNDYYVVFWDCLIPQTTTPENRIIWKSVKFSPVFKKTRKKFYPTIPEFKKIILVFF
jgi:hypothetical protein